MKTKNERIKVTANQKEKTFTIRKYIDGKFFVKYRTLQMSKKEFSSCEHNTENDWQQFLNATQDYYKV